MLTHTHNLSKYMKVFCVSVNIKKNTRVSLLNILLNKCDVEVSTATAKSRGAGTAIFSLLKTVFLHPQSLTCAAGLIAV